MSNRGQPHHSHHLHPVLDRRPVATFGASFRGVYAYTLSPLPHAGAGAAGAAGARARTTLDALVVRPSRGTVEELAASRELGP